MPGRCNEIKQSVHPVISEPWVTLDARFFREDIIVLAFKMSYNLRETAEEYEISKQESKAESKLPTLLHCQSDHRNQAYRQLLEICVSPLHPTLALRER